MALFSKKDNGTRRVPAEGQRRTPVWWHCTACGRNWRAVTGDHACK